MQLPRQASCDELYLHVAIACRVVKYQMNIQRFTCDYLTMQSTNST